MTSTRRSTQIVTMGFPDRGEENLMRQTSRCKNFQPNMFNKTKCQNCFRTREAHDLGDDDGSNKPKKALHYGYLFVAPGIDFDNPMSRNRKWQRRCFILYENGELCYALDYDPNTIPQGVVNMYQCTKVFNADKLTGHSFSMGIATPDETTYIRAETREEKDGWYETLIEYPEINKEAERQKKKKRGVFPMLAKDSEKPPRIEDEQAEAKPDVPASSEDPLSEIESLEREDELGTDMLVTTARDTTDIYTASSKAARKEKSNLRRSHSALEHRPEKYDKKQTVRRTPSAQTPSTTTETSSMPAKKDREERLNRRHTTTGRTEVKEALGNDEPDVSGKGDASRRPVSDGSSYKYSGSSGMRSRHSESALSELEAELGSQADSVLKSHRESLPAQSNSSEPSLHRNNNNVYKDVSHRLSPTQQATTSSSRKSSISDRSVSPTDSQSTTDSQTKKSQPSKADTNSQNLLSQEELQRLDVPKRGRLKLNKALIEGETQSPSKRTIERRRHAQERRSRHTLDGSTVPFPISERKNTPEGTPRLKRSNSDPNLADNEELKRREIAETFPGLLHLKNGWLMKRDSDQEDWNKYWFVLRDNKLSHFKDSSDESPSNLAGAVDLAQCKEATETSASRNYGFQIKMEDDSVHHLGAMTSKIRTNWIQAINKAIATAQKEASPVVPEKEPINLVQIDAAPVPQEQTTLVLLDKPPPIPQVSTAPDVIPTPLPKQDGTDSSRSNLAIDLTSRHRKSSLDSRLSETASPTDREPAFQERQGSIRSKERRSRRSFKGDDLKLQKSSSRSSINGRSSSTSSDVFETPPNTPTPIELRIEEPVRRTSTTSTRIERDFRAESPIQIQKIEQADSLKSQTDQLQGDSISIENSQQRKSFDVYQRQTSLDNENEQKVLVSQLETVVKKLSQVELQNQTLHMEVKQARNASELVKHEKEELHDKLETTEGALDKRAKECETIQARFEKLVSDYQESEKELSKARSSLKTERDKAVTMIERLNQQIEIVEAEKKEYRERAKKWEGEITSQNKTMRQLEKNQEESQEIIKKLLAKMEGYKQRIEAKGGEDMSATKEYVQKLERHQQELQGVNIQLQTRLQEVEKEMEAKSQETPLRLDSESELETELADMRMELSDRDEQIEQLSEQLEAEFSEKSELQKKYDSIVAESAQFVLEGQGDKAPARSSGDMDLENKLKEAAVKLESLKMQLTKELTMRKQTEDRLSGEASARQGLETHMQEMEEQLRIAMEEKHQTSQAQEDTKNLMELLQGKNKEVEKLQIEMKRMDADRISLMEQTGRDQATVDVLKQQLRASEETKNTLEGDFDCVLQSKVDLEESAKQLTAELATVKSELELLRQASQNASSTEAEEEARKEAAKKEVQLLRAQVEKVQSMYTEDMFKKEQLLAEKHEACSELERRLTNLQSKLTQKEEVLAKSDRESGEKLLEMTNQMEQMGQKVDRGDRELKRLRQELKSSQDNYDALELKHMQNVEEAKQQQKSQQEQLELMGRRIQDLTSKLGLAERKVRDLTSVEAGWSSFGGGNGDISVSGVHVGAMSGTGLNTSHNSQSSGIHSQLMEVEQVLGSAESRIQRQHQRASALEGKIESVEKHMEAIEQAGPSNSISSFDHDVSVNSSSSPSCNSSINQLAGAATTAAKIETSDTSESSDCPSSDGADGGSKIKILESRLAEMEKKLKQVTHRLVDVTTRELEKRKAYQAKCVTENRLKDQVRGLQREVLALRQQTEKVQSHSESSARQTHHLLAQCRQHLMRIQPAKPSQSKGESSTDSPRVSKESTNTANTTDKTITAVPSSAATYHVTDACHTLDKAIDLLISQLKSLDTRKRKSLTEFSESVILGLGDLSGISDGDSPKSPRSCPPSPLFFSTSPPLSPDISPRGSKHTSKVSDKRYGQLFRFPAKSSHGLGSQGFSIGKVQRIRYCHCLLEVEYLNSFLAEIPAKAVGEDDIIKLLSCHRMIEAEDRDGSIEVMFPGDKNVSGYAAGLSKTIIREAESEFLAMKEPAESYPVIGSNEISAVYAACTTFFTSNWEFSHSLEKDLEVKCDALAKILADDTAAKKQESPADSKKTVLKPKESGYSNPQRIAGKNDSGLGLESDLAPFAEGIAYEEALRVAMECVSSELVLAEALQCVNSTIEDFVGKIDSEEVKCKRVLTLLRSVGIHRFGLIRDAIARQLEATSGLIRQKYWDYLQESEDEIDSKIEENKKKKKKSKKETKDTLKNGTPKSSCEEHEGATEKDIAVLVLMKAVLSGLVVHLRSELSMLAEGNSNQNNDSSGGLLLDGLGDVVLPSQVIDYSDHVTGTIKEDGENRRQVGVDEEGVMRARVSSLESITAEHSRNISMVRERYEAIIKGERTVHEQELIQLRQRLVTADSTVKRLEEDITAMGKRDGGILSQVDLGSVLARGQVDLKEAHEHLNIMRANILELVEYHKTKLSQMERGIQAIMRCYQKETEDLHASYREKLKEMRDKGRQDLATAQHRYQEGISEMECHHETQTKRLVKEAKEQVNEEMLAAQQRNHAQMVEEMERRHRKEMEDREAERMQEKEKEDESVTTALSVLKKAYEEELEKEKYMSQESYPKDVETIMKRHREVVTQMNRDWVILSTKFSEQCKENAMLSKALRAMQRSQKEAHEKLQRAQVENRKRVTSLGEELARIDMDEDEDSEEEDDNEEEDVQKEKDFKVLEMNLRLQELELEFAREEIDSLRQAVERNAGASQRTTGEENIVGAGEKTRRSSFTSRPESDGATRPKNRRSLSDLTHMFHKSKKGEKK